VQPALCLHFTPFQIHKDPSQQLKIVGRSCKLSRDAAQYCHSPEKIRFLTYATYIIHVHCRYSFCEGAASLMPWAGQEGCLIDRYDGRALLDLIPGPPAKSSVPSADELLLERYECFTNSCSSHASTLIQIPPAF
jgi:hypothetical protein